MPCVIFSKPMTGEPRFLPRSVSPLSLLRFLAFERAPPRLTRWAAPPIMPPADENGFKQTTCGTTPHLFSSLHLPEALFDFDEMVKQ